MELQKAMFHIIDNAITKTVPRQKRADYLFMGMFVIQTNTYFFEKFQTNDILWEFSGLSKNAYISMIKAIAIKIIDKYNIQ